MALPEARDWSVLDELLVRALALPSQKREQHLAAICAGDPSRVRQLRRLLERAAAPPVDGLLHSPLLLEALTGLSGPRQGDRLGDWRLGRRLATGGMSEVFDAERMTGEVRQRAALKLLATGHDGSLPLRFARECRILATLSDARIARYYDSGVAADGRPWLAMEAVDGVPLDRHVQERALDLRQRIALFGDLLGAVAHAHRHLVVHRDLKPSNVLVTAEGQLKLIDFGIAKALDEANPLATAVESRLLTLDYASPEQLQGGTITVASDIYQLGLVLYGLVARRHPFADGTCDRLERIRSVLERVPEAPSRVLWRQGARDQARSARGDLDAIVLKALAKAPADRYAGVDAFSADLSAWLHGRPVQARRSRALARTLKFLRRHRVASAVSVAAMLLGLALASAWLSQMIRANRAAGSAQAVLALLERTLHADRYGQQPQPPETVAELLEQTETSAHRVLSDRPDVLARTLLLVGNARLGRGEYRRAARVLESARIAALAAVDDDDLDTEVIQPLVVALHYSGDYDQALRWSEHRLAGARSARGRLHALAPHADLLHSLGDYAGSEQAARESLRLARQLYGGDHGISARNHQMLATVLRDRGEFAQARMHIERAIAIDRAEGVEQHVGLAVSLDNFGQVLLQNGDLAEAQTALREGKSIRDRLFQPGYLSRAWVDHRLALLALATGSPARAVAELTTMVDLYARDLGESSHITASARSDLGWAWLAVGRPDQATLQFDRADAVLARWHDGRHPRRAEGLLGRAVIALHDGHVDVAGDLATQAFAMRRRDTDDRHPMLAAICRVAQLSGRPCAIDLPPASPTALATRQLDLALAASAGLDAQP